MPPTNRSNYSLRCCRWHFLAVMAILQRFTRLLNRRHGFRRNNKRCAIDSAIGGGILIRILESLTDFENAVDNDGVNTFVSLELIALLVNVAKRFTMAS
jgi:hypothetical protein